MPLNSIDTPLLASLGRFLDVSAFRQGVIAANLANVDTPGYRARDINFRKELERAGGDSELPPLVHEVAGLMERPDGNNVSVEREGLLMAQNQLKFQAGIQLLRLEFRRLSTAIREGK